MTKKERYEGVVGWFRANMPVAQSELDFDSPFHLLIAVILSAQCTDKRVNMFTPAIFRRFETPESLAKASYDEVFEYVRSISFPGNKSRHLIGMAKMLHEDYGSVVPSEPDELRKLPGVGLKTANVVASIVYNKPVIAVDTHVFRVARRIGLSAGETPEAVCRELEKNIAPEERPVAHHWLILHGRYVCTARKPQCTTCGLSKWCRSYGKSI